MLSQFLPPLLIFLAVVDLALAGHGLAHRRKVPRVELLVWYMLGAACTSLGYGLELLSGDLDAKLVWVGLRYIGNTMLIAPVCLLLSLWYTGHEKWLKPAWARLLFILPLITMLGLLTNPWHHLHYVWVGLDSSGPLVMLVKTNGPLYIFMVIYTLVYMLTGMWLALQALFSLPRQYLPQTLAVFGGGAIPFAFTLAYLLGWRPLMPGLNLTPLSYVLSSFMFWWAVFRHQLFSMPPVTLRLLFETIPTGVIALNGTRQVVSANPAAQAQLGLEGGDLIGQPLERVCAHWPALLERLTAGPVAAAHSEIQHWDSERYYEVDVAQPPAASQFESRAIKLVLLTDVTQRRAAELDLLEQRHALAALAERERLARDLHDGVGQLTGFVSVQSQAARQYLASGQIQLADAALAGLQDAARAAHADVRSFILDLQEGRPAGAAQSWAGADQNDFFAELPGYVARFEELYGLKVRLELPEQANWPVLEADTSLQLLRIVQEALANVRKHSGKDEARVTVRCSSTELQVRVEDDGVGFDPGAVLPEGRFGRGIMAERAAQIGASLEIDSVLGHGTRLRVSLGLAPPPQEVSARLAGLRVLLVDDHELFRIGLRNLLAARGVQVVGEAGDGRQALELARQLQPDLVLMDMNMPEMDGVEATRLLHQALPGVQVVVLSVAREPAILMDALRAGAAGYLLKDMQANELFEMLEAVGRGERPVAPALAGQALRGLAGLDEDCPLNERQLEVLRLAALDMTTAQIAQRLNLSESAVKYHFHQILERMQVESRAQALTQAALRGWIERRRNIR